MSGESSKRSNLIDVTYQQLHSILSGQLEGTTSEQLSELLTPRLEQLRTISEPFGKPSDASKKKIDSGSVTLVDGVVILIENADKEFIFAISNKFQIDQVQALVLLRSFLYNEGLPSSAGSSTNTSIVDELVEAITPFYFSERLSILRVLIPLFRAKENPLDLVYEIATSILPKLLPNGQDFVESIITEYLRKTKETPPESLNRDPRAASRWAKQNAKEQLVILEVLFWTMWGYVPCYGSLVFRIYEAAYSTNLGSIQRNSTLLLDDEGQQLLQDSAGLWILITVEVLELETLAGSATIEISASPSNKDIYTSDPDSLKRIHELVTSHGNSQHSCTYLAWTFVLSRLASVEAELKEIPDTYRSFFELLLPHLSRAYSKDREPTHVMMSRACLQPDAGLFKLMLTLLTSSPLFVTAAAWRAGSTVTDPNAIAFRSVLKGLIIALVELVPVEMIPDFDSFVEVWVALFGRSESQSVAGICKQFWESDWQQGIARRAILDVARSRFPIHVKPLIRLLRSMTATGFLDTDPLSTADHSLNGQGLSEESDLCDRHVFYYMDQLPTFSQIIPISACTGAHALYEKQQERYGSPSSSMGLTYINLRPIKLPGGSTLPARSIGRLLSGDGGDFIVICWQHEHSGWKVVLELLTDYVNRRRRHSGAGVGYQDISFGRRPAVQSVTLGVEDIGVEMDSTGDEGIITDAFDLIRSLIRDNPAQTEQLVESLEAGDAVVAHTMTETQPPDLVQLTTMILEEALSRSGAHSRDSTLAPLITSAMSVLSALLALPRYSNRVWLYIRSTTALFGSDRSVSIASATFAAERATGHYTMTLALLHLVQELFHEASTSILHENPRLQQVKEEVLLRAVRFVHTEIWVEHLGWKYAQLGDRFEIGRRVTSLYLDVLKHAPLTLAERPFATLSQSVADILLYKATTSTINPLVSSIATGGSTLGALYSSRRFGDARRLIFLLEAHLQLVRFVLNHKQRSSVSSKPCLLEQALCSRVNSGAALLDPNRSKLDPIEVLTRYVKERDIGNTVPLEAMRLLSTLCVSLSTLQPSPPTIIAHLENPEATVTSLVRIIQHPYDELSLRNAVWNFISLAVDKEPALASLFVTGQFRTPTDLRNKGSDGDQSKAKPTSAMDVARDMLTNWEEMWDLNPQLLASVMRFLDVVWQHGLEHASVLEGIRKDSTFWSRLASFAYAELGPVPDYQTESFVNLEGWRRSNLHEGIAIHAYRTIAKSYALHIIGLDIDIHLQSRNKSSAPDKPTSFIQVESYLKSEEQLTDLISEAAPSSYDPRLYDELMEHMKVEFPALTLEQLRSQEPLEERELGDDFAFSTSLLRSRLLIYRVADDGTVDRTDRIEKQLYSINLNLSLAHSETALVESWQFLLRQVVPYLRGDIKVRPVVLAIAASVSSDISTEKRSGDMMATIHGSRLSLLLALLEVAWFSTADKTGELQSFVSLVHNIHGIILNDQLPPSKSFLGSFNTPFHRTLLQIAYFCARHCKSLSRRPKALNAEQRLTIAAMLESTLNFAIDALRVVFVAARSRIDVELDRDMDLLVAVFEHCISPEINPSSTSWLTRCQETDIIRASLDLYVHTDLVGLSDLPLLLTRRQPLYAPYILQFHMALASIPSAAERFASEGVLTAYSNNYISPAISAGRIDIVLPEFPGDRSPAHYAYCSMLAIVAGVVRALGRHNHYFDAEASGLVQLFGDQISRSLSWTIGEPLTLPLLEEIEQVVNLFSSIADNTPSTTAVDSAVEKVLHVFTTHALLLLQQLNYALTHPNHLASLFEPVTASERAQIEKEAGITDPLKRPLIATLVHRLFKLSSSILSTLISVSHADVVLIGEQQDWLLREALIVPHSKVVLGEPASMGTLLELGNCTLDLLKDLIGRPAGQTLTLVVPANMSDKPLDVRQGITTGRRNLEAVLLYAVTQLAMWLSKSEFDIAAGDMDADEPLTDIQKPDAPKNERGAPRRSLTLGDRLRRSMTGELAADLQSLLNQAKPVILKSQTMTGGVDLTQVLSNFLHERIISPS